MICGLNIKEGLTSLIYDHNLLDLGVIRKYIVELTLSLLG